MKNHVTLKKQLLFLSNFSDPSKAFRPEQFVSFVPSNLNLNLSVPVDWFKLHTHELRWHRCKSKSMKQRLSDNYDVIVDIFHNRRQFPLDERLSMMLQTNLHR